MNQPVTTLSAMLCLAVAPTTATAQRASDVLAPCTVDGAEGPALCGRLSVPERRESPDARRIELNVIVLVATDQLSLPDPLVFLAGGGVLPATRLARFLSRAMADVRRSRDILLVDQRGTGTSNPLSCTLQLPPLKGVEPASAEIRQRVDACITEIATHADVRAYSTTRAMHDLEDVRSRLGYGQLNLWGMSYGTKAAREYLRLYPAQVRSLVLSGVVPRATAWWGDQAAHAESVLREYYRFCERDPTCRSAFPNPREALDRLLAKLQREPIRVSDTVEVSATDIRRVLYNRLSESWSAVTIPLLVQLALDGDVSAFVPPRQIGPGPIPRGIFYGITCSEEFPRQSADRIRASAEGTFLGPMAGLQHLAVCAAWPVWPIESGLWEEVRSDVPALVLNGSLDHVTVMAYAESVAALLPKSRLLALPLRGHNDFDACIGEMIQRFLRDPQPDAVDASCLARTPLLRFPTRKAELPGR
jgi:pimeloyl-ACP methyl ester carboxylesterase